MAYAAWKLSEPVYRQWLEEFLVFLPFSVLVTDANNHHFF